MGGSAATSVVAPSSPIAMTSDLVSVCLVVNMRGGPGESGLERTDCMQGGMRVNRRHEVLGFECACAVIAIAGCRRLP